VKGQEKLNREQRQKIPEFAVVGHPNEGKSSVLSTLAEDDSVRVSPVPGETKEWYRFPVIIDNREIISFVDTPGFQNPRRTLKWMQAYQGTDNQMLVDFIGEHQEDPAYHDDCQLFQPLADGAGVIFVVDASRPLRNVDRAEMEILRLTNRPRMAILNFKEEGSDFIDDWTRELRKHFNSTRVFNSLQATYGQRISLLESLKAIDQELEPTLRIVISGFEQDWNSRIERTAELLIDMLSETMSWTMSTPVSAGGGNEEKLHREMADKFNRLVNHQEQEVYQQIRRLFKHNIFNLELPARSILRENLFSEKTWQFLGLSRKQLIITGTLGGATMGAGLDLATAGISFGVFSTLGGMIGAATTAIKGKEMLSGTKILGVRLDNMELKLGPVDNIQLFYILLDRSILYFHSVINWAHARRDSPEVIQGHEQKERLGYTSSWPRSDHKLCERFFRAVTLNREEDIDKCSPELHNLIVRHLHSLSEQLSTL
jgi:GTPase Era involved in 16S rRNA processing